MSLPEREQEPSLASDGEHRQSQTEAASKSADRRGDEVGRRVFLVTLGALGALALFASGIYVANKKPAPYRFVERNIELIEDAWRLRGFTPKHAVNPAPGGSTREPWNARFPDELLPGYRALTGYVSRANAFGVWILDERGEKVHERILNYAALDPDGPSGGSESPHAFLFLPDGSVIVNVDKGDAIARYDVCGDAIWSREGAFHHSLSQDPQGGVWTWQGDVTTFDQYHTLVRFDPDTGETLETIELVAEIVDASPESRAVFSVAPGQPLQRMSDGRGVRDLFHPNDLEVLSPEMADAFPMFDVGDLLMSFRNIDLVTVVDRDSGAIKWWSHGPWHRQHDPDFLPDGRISVFDNDTGHGTSTIVRIDPMTRAVDVLEVESDFRFYTPFMGKHETLADGTVQIVVPYEGRVLEVAGEGRVLLEINSVYDEAHNALVSDAVHLAPDFFETPPERFACGPSDRRP